MMTNVIGKESQDTGTIEVNKDPEEVENTGHKVVKNIDGMNKKRNTDESVMVQERDILLEA